MIVPMIIMIIITIILFIIMIMIPIARIAKLLEVAPGGETDDWGEDVSTDHNLYQVNDDYVDDDDNDDDDDDDDDEYNQNNHHHDQTKELKGDTYTEGRRVRAVASARQRSDFDKDDHHHGRF